MDIYEALYIYVCVYVWVFLCTPMESINASCLPTISINMHNVKLTRGTNLDPDRKISIWGKGIIHKMSESRTAQSIPLPAWHMGPP